MILIIPQNQMIPIIPIYMDELVALISQIGEGCYINPDLRLHSLSDRPHQAGMLIMPSIPFCERPERENGSEMCSSMRSNAIVKACGNVASNSFVQFELYF